MTTPILALLLALAVSQDSATGGVRGQVRSERTGEPVPYATIQVMDLPAPLATRADSAGNYVLQGVPAGRRMVRAYHLDHAPLDVEVLVPAGKAVVLDFVLVFRPVSLPALLAQASPPRSITDTVRASTPELAPAAVRALETAPGMVEIGLSEFARNISPQEPVDPSDVLYVRGAPADLKLVLLDGAPVYSPFHVGGLVQPFDPEVLRAANLYLGGAPARYDGGLSYVLELETRAGRRTGAHMRGSLDLLSGDVLLEGPIGSRGGLLLGGRAVHGAGTRWLLDDRLPYAYADAIGRFDLTVGSRGALGLTGFWNQERVQLAGGDRPEKTAEWGNRAVSLRYQGPLLGSDADLTAAFGSFLARLPIGSDSTGVLTDGAAGRLRLVADLARQIGEMRLHYGLTYERTTLEYSAHPAGRMAGAVVAEAAAVGDVAGAHLDADWRPGERVRLRGGLRADIYSSDPRVRLAPRLSATWLLSDRAALTLALGRYHQFLRSAEPVAIAESDSTVAELYLPPPLALARASHMVVSLDQELVEGLRLGIEGFYKTFDGLPSATGEAGAATGDDIAHASGVDLWLRRAEGRFTGWLGYSLGWVWSERADRASTAVFAGRQLLSAGLGGPIGSRGRFAARVAYGAGMPYAAVPMATHDAPTPEAASGYSDRAIYRAIDANQEAPPLDGAPDEPHLRLDLEVSHRFSGRLAGAPYTLSPYLRVINALDRRDALFYRRDADGGSEPRPLAALPLLPVIGLEWRF